MSRTVHRHIKSSLLPPSFLLKILHEFTASSMHGINTFLLFLFDSAILKSWRKVQFMEILEKKLSSPLSPVQMNFGGSYHFRRFETFKLLAPELFF